MKSRPAWLIAALLSVAPTACGDGSPHSDSPATSSGAPGLSGASGASNANASGAGGAITTAGSGSSGGSGGSGGSGAGGTNAGVGTNAGAAGTAAQGGGGADTGASGTNGAGSAGQPSDAGTGPGGGGGTSPQSEVDAFGIPVLRPSKASGPLWTSQHWAAGEPRTIDGNDPSDPTGWSNRRGDTQLMELDGAGVMSMGGAQPRFYIQPKSGQKQPFFRDIEFTGYYRRTAEDGAFNSGFSVGLRAHLNGHGDVDHCLASTYYLIFRNSGSWIFDKELDHPNDSPRQGGDLPYEGTLPIDQWIGMKYLAYNLPGDTEVKLEAYIDATSGGVGTKPSDWKKLGETVDAGDWNASNGDCGFPQNTVVTEGGGVVFIRNTAVAKVQYQKVSWREIVP
jgi:hypothetical protein